MIDAIIMRLINWLEGLACKCFYYIERINLGSKKREWIEDENGIIKLCQSIYRIKLTYRKEQS